MILYGKSCDFIGIGKEELSFLGFENIEQFKELCSDVADLFVNKPGFIYKFKNFSWIEYALNSGAPKKNVILKLKNGNERETTLKIKEIFLYNPQNNENLYYTVEFINNSLQNNSEISDPIVELAIEETLITTKKSDIEDDYYAPKEDQDSDKDFEEMEVDFSDSFTVENSQAKLKINDGEDNKREEFKSDIEYDYDAPKEEVEGDFSDSFTVNESEVKLKINDDEENNNEEFKKVSFSNDASTKEDTVDNSDKENKEVDLPIKIKSYDEDENKQEIVLNTEEINNETLLSEANQEEIIFDVEKCAEELGLDISLIAEVINDYLQNIETTMPKIQNYLDTNDETSLQSALYSLKGISDNLHINNISQQLTNIIRASSKNLKKEEVEKFKIIISKFKDNFL